MKILVRSLLLSAVILFSGANAGETSLAVLIQQQEALRAELTGGTEGLTPRQVRLISDAQEEFFTIVKGKQVLDELAIEEKIRVENALETINAQVVGTRQAADDQQVCWSEAKVGSRMRVNRCASQKELEDERTSARSFMAKPAICVPPGCG